MIETTERPIVIPYPETDDLTLSLNVGACRLSITPAGNGADWVTGSYDDPTGMLPAKITQEGGTVKIAQEHHRADGWRFPGRAPRFTLAVGRAKPFKLALETGASEATLDLGGVPISRLVVKQGAGKATIDFSTPNPREMSLLEVSAGAVGLELRHLANANCAEYRIEGGAASYVVDFGGTLSRDAHARISTGLSSVELIIPAATPAKITAEAVLGGMDVDDGFRKQAGAYATEAGVAAVRPLLTIEASVALGSFRLRLSPTG